MKQIILAGDIGGTKTILGIFSKNKKKPIPILTETYSSKSSSCLENLMDRFLSSIANNNYNIENACLGVAGHIENQNCKATNLSWEISAKKLKKRYSLTHISLINDLEAISFSIPFLEKDDLFILNKGKSIKNNPIGVIAPGTGLGMSILICSNKRHLTIPSEGGHCDFAPKNENEFLLWQFLNKNFKGHVSLERLLSGQGLYNIYLWLKSIGTFQEPKYLKEKIKKGDPAKEISLAAIENNEEICLQTLNIFSSILGSAAGNLALTGLTLGGLYLGGGILPKILPKLDINLFMDAFLEKGRFKELMQKIPVYIILNKNAALLGAAAYI